MINTTPRWQKFAQEIQSCFLRYHESPSSDHLQTCHSMETDIRALCIAHFPLKKQLPSMDIHMRSLTARMWFARRQLRMVFIISVKTMFQSWRHSITFARVHAQIRRYGRQNKRTKLLGNKRGRGTFQVLSLFFSIRTSFAVHYKFTILK